MFSSNHASEKPTPTEMPSYPVCFFSFQQRSSTLFRAANPTFLTVLLRVLEYYHGIMILTTNRIKSIDVAVQSRIHLAVRYDDLTRDQMRSILGTILTKFNVEEREKQCIVDSFKEHAEDTGLKLNGRQIRNLVFSAQAMASADGRESISWSDIKCVTKVTREFQTQLKSIVETERAYREVSKEGD